MGNRIDRIGTAAMYDDSLRKLNARQSDLATMQDKLSAGKRVLRASDDPVAAAQAERALTRLARIQSDQRALQARRDTITQGEGTLGEAVGLLQDFRELVVSAGGASLTAHDRATIAQQLQGLREQLLQAANRQDTNGIPLFAALGSMAAPFSGPRSSAPDYAFQGQPGQVASDGVRLPGTLDGYGAFMFDPRRDAVYTAQVSPIPTDRRLTTTAVQPTAAGQATGDGYRITFGAVRPGATAGTSSITYTITNTRTGVVSAPVVPPDFPRDQPVRITVTGIPGLRLDIEGTPAAGDSVSVEPSASLLSTLDSAIRSIRDAPNNNAAIQAVGQGLANIDRGLEQVQALRGYAGELLNRADRITADQEKRSTQLEGDRSRAEDLDMVQGISDFQNQQTGYEAALKSYARVQRLSLFDFLG
ncbi:flagellar hook-associated protein 3 [Verminephrobacter aporrectodeae subsp. tuberculatae]|uniref:flagellar hook-associated protein FlgL n=1 Tax=Verminephrobacter aporrectodeae TaxID=1110389 RepID=UPI0022383483|nr:flagellar hook-associated protein FlgL [Verminephrobacter aporrectodeae]MCW5258023.1 flagellar hook-associated protein 3 [Verminephrobacter aporrectodeae subsp. tuberculatae]